jgi:DNA-binding transcriptional LysR family regulator
VVQACRSAGFEPDIGFESDDYHVMQGFIAAGLGVTLLPDLALPTLRSELVVRPTDPPAPQRRVWATTRSEGARSPATEEMIVILADVGQSIAERSAKRLQLVA